MTVQPIPLVTEGPKPIQKFPEKVVKKAPSFASATAFHEGEFLSVLGWELRCLSETLEKNLNHLLDAALGEQCSFELRP